MEGYVRQNSMYLAYILIVLAYMLIILAYMLIILLYIFIILAYILIILLYIFIILAYILIILAYIRIILAYILIILLYIAIFILDFILVEEKVTLPNHSMSVLISCFFNTTKVTWRHGSVEECSSNKQKVSGSIPSPDNL